MSANPITVKAQWALYGKTADNEGYRVVACSTGDLTREHFADALNRFQLGTPDSLPQVSVSYLRHGAEQGTSYLALAIQRSAEEGQRYADGVLQFDNQGRDTTFTSYLCLPYRPLVQVSYLDMYQVLQDIKLPVQNGPPIEVTITVPAQRVLAIDPLAMRVAPLLLTGTPVCVVGAERTSLTERLRFIDAVMTLLPYGYRSKMTAATWTRETYRDHRFRLFFSSVPRVSKPPDYAVTWGEPDDAAIAGGEAGVYHDWLAETIYPLERLAALRPELGFGEKAALNAFESAAGTLPRPPTDSADSREPLRPPVESGEIDFAEQTLIRCVEHANAPTLIKLRSDIARLRNYAKTGEIDGPRRERYRKLITSLGLLKHNDRIEKQEGKLYDALLALAFGTPLDYDGYCQLEECLELEPGQPPHQALLAAIERAEMSVPVTCGIVYWHQRTADEKKLNKWLLSEDLDIAELIGLLAADWRHPQHARIICDVALDYLWKARGRYESVTVRRALQQHGYLAGALHFRHRGKDQYQISALYQFLKAAYQQGIDKQDIVLILAGPSGPPTPALLAAVLMHLRREADCRVAQEAYSYGSLMRMGLDSATTSRLGRPTMLMASEVMKLTVMERPQLGAGQP